jgi:hypothetical protein
MQPGSTDDVFGPVIQNGPAHRSLLAHGTEIGDFPSPLHRCGSVDRFWPASGQGPGKVLSRASPEPKELFEASWVERGSPRRAGDGEGVSGEMDDGSNSNERLSMTKVWM